eukprot:scaffold1109_cov146-Skeletonema_marinoi.AAC.6
MIRPLLHQHQQPAQSASTAATMTMTMLQLSCKILIVITNDNDETFLHGRHRYILEGSLILILLVSQNLTSSSGSGRQE